MACNGGGTCDSNNGCSKDVLNSTDDSPLSSSSTVCTKCKSSSTIATTHPGVAAGDAARFCVDCFRSNLRWKFRFAVTSNAMIDVTDKVLLAFSGGNSSRVALQFVHEMQYKAQKNFEASRDKSLTVFDVGVAFIDGSALFPVPSDEFDKALEDMKLIVSNLRPPAKEFHIVPIESLFTSDDRKEKLNELLHAVSDVTGKEDLQQHLRISLLQQIAVENGYTKLVLGTCTSRIACHVLAATAKGKGYSLPADIQYVDARWKIPIVLPLRDCLAQELEMLCHLDSLKTMEVFNRPGSGINGLITSFVKLLQEENPSRESTIVRTAGKLTPFHFNKIPETDDLEGHLASKRRQKKYNLKTNGFLPPDSFCPICNSPLSRSDLVNSCNDSEDEVSGDSFAAKCCWSCNFQILPKSSTEQFYKMLPQQIIGQADDHNQQRLLREQIQDYLLSESEDESLNLHSRVEAKLIDVDSSV